MSFLAVLILQSNSAENPPTFVTLAKNHSISLSRDAEQNLGSSSVLILAIGSAQDSISLFNNLLVGPTNDPARPGFFQVRNGTIPDPPEFPFHPGMSLTTFCRNWGLDCRQAPPNRNIVLIASPGGEDEHTVVAWMSVAVLSITTFPVYLTGSSRRLLSNWTRCRMGRMGRVGHCWRLQKTLTADLSLLFLDLIFPARTRIRQ
jgi:hypothetical protein